MTRGVDGGSSAAMADAGSQPNLDLAAAAGSTVRRWWFWPLAIYVVMRVVNGIMFTVASRSAIPVEDFVNAGHDHFTTTAGVAPPGYLTSVTNWDGQWYWEIAVNGYPTELPLDETGAVKENPWAFFPLYPILVRVVMAITRLDFPVAASLVSLVCGAAAMLILYRIAHHRYGHLGGTLAVLAMSSFICAPVLQMAYAEGLALALLLAVLWYTLERRYLVAGLLLAALAFTRGVAAPLAPALLLYAVVSWRRGRLQRQDVRSLLLLAASAGALAFGWVITAAITTGRWDAYEVTQKAWNPELTTLPLARFVERNGDVPGGPVAALALAVIWAAFLLWFLTRGQKEVLLGLWTGVYVTYLLAVTDWNWSNVRYYLLALPVLWPLVGPLRGERGPISRVLVASVVASAGVAMQWWYIRYCVTISTDLVQVP